MTTAETLKARLENRPGVLGATIITRSGTYFDFIDPRPEQITAKDLAWGQANTCRFNGQCLEFYSVAQHARLVAEIVPPEHAFAALLHDAAEAYVGDVVGPLKQLLPEFKAIEHRVEAAIFAKYGVQLPLNPCIKHADLRLLRTEQRDLTAARGDEWNGLSAYEPLPTPIVAEPPGLAAARWLQMFRALGGGE